MPGRSKIISADLRTSDIKPRRRHSYFANRRPRFLVRRTTGNLGVDDEDRRQGNHRPQLSDSRGTIDPES